MHPTLRTLKGVSRLRVATPSGGGSIVDSATLTTGLVSYYSFNANADDMHGSNDGTLSGPVPAAGKLNGAFNYDGSNDATTLPFVPNGNQTVSYSVSYWFKPDVTFSSASGTSQVLISTGQGTAGGNLIGGVLNQSDGKIRAYVYNGLGGFPDVSTTQTSWTADTWYHIVVTYDSSGNDMYIYVDGTLSGSNTTASNTPSAYAFTTVGLGVNVGYSANYFDGDIDEVGFWNRTLTSDEVTELYNSGSPLPYNNNTISEHATLPTNLLECWSMNDADISGTTLSGSTGTRNGTISGATTGAAGVMAESLSFNGSSDYVDVGTYDESGDLTISAWVKTDTVAAGTRRIFSNYNASGSAAQYDLRLASATFQFAINNGGEDITSSGYTAVVGVWYHVVVVVSSGSSQIYVNGSAEGPSNAQTPPTSSFGDTSIGRAGDFTGSGQWDGNIDQVCFWDRALTSGEVADLYNGGAGMPYD